MAALESPNPRQFPLFHPHSRDGATKLELIVVTQSLGQFPTVQDQPKKTSTWRWSSL